jgi:hypothetical protein
MSDSQERQKIIADALEEDLPNNLSEAEKKKRRAAFEIENWGRRITSDGPTRGTLGFDVDAQNKLMLEAIRKQRKQK